MKIFCSMMAVIGMLYFFGGWATSHSSPQEAAAGAVGIAFGVLPYILYKLDYCTAALERQDEIIRLLKKLAPEQPPKP